MLKILKIKELFYIDLTSTYGYDYYIVNNEKTQEKKLSCVEIKTIIGVQIQQQLTHYVDKDSNKLSIDDFQEKTKELLKESEYTDYDGRTWNTIEDKHNYEKFIDKWDAIKKEVHKETVLEYTLEEYPESPIPSYIKPYRLISNDKQNVNKCLFRYFAMPIKMAIEIANKHNFIRVDDVTFSKENTTGMKYSIPTHSKLRYMKINGKYVVNDSMNRFYGIQTGTLDECITRYNEHYNKIEKIFLTQKNLIENPDIPENYREEIYDKLKSILYSVSSIMPKAKSYSYKSQSISKINDLMNELVKEPKNGNK